MQHGDIINKVDKESTETLIKWINIARRHYTAG
jgi:hypothetical protein